MSRTMRRVALPARLLKLVGVLVLAGVTCVLLIQENISWRSPDNVALLSAFENGMVNVFI